MLNVRHILAATAALVLSGTAASVHAETAKTSVGPSMTFTGRDVFTPDRNQWNPLSAHRSMQWDANRGRWGIKLDMDQPVGRDMLWKDVQAGAYFKVTPSLRVGGAVALGDPQQPSREIVPREPAPRVRLETAFKF